eukprot:scaffold7029_cov375-Pinguiococcus_pyrenoidosus.AAC.19
MRPSYSNLAPESNQRGTVGPSLPRPPITAPGSPAHVHAPSFLANRRRAPRKSHVTRATIGHDPRTSYLWKYRTYLQRNGPVKAYALSYRGRSILVPSVILPGDRHFRATNPGQITAFFSASPLPACFVLAKRIGSGSSLPPKTPGAPAFAARNARPPRAPPGERRAPGEAILRLDSMLGDDLDPLTIQVRLFGATGDFRSTEVYPDRRVASARASAASLARSAPERRWAERRRCARKVHNAYVWRRRSTRPTTMIWPRSTQRTSRARETITSSAASEEARR